MRGFWHPLSTILLANPRCFATDGLVRLFLEAEQRVELVYAGDRMWPTLGQGERYIIIISQFFPVWTH